MGILVNVLSAFLAGFFASTVAAGPVSFLVLKNALIGRYEESVMMVFGSAVMETIYCSFALTFLGAIFLRGAKIKFFSEIISIFILFIIGIYLFKTDINKKTNVKIGKIEDRNKTKPFLTAFILVALNPTIILTWSATTAVLISFKIIEINRLIDVVTFAFFAGIGTILGGITMISLVNRYKLKFSKNLIAKIVSLMGIVLIFLSAYLVLKVFSFV